MAEAISVVCKWCECIMIDLYKPAIWKVRLCVCCEQVR